MGRVKTRLARQIGQAGAVQVFRATVSAVAGRLMRDHRFETSFAVAPDAMVHTRSLPARMRRRRQGGGDLGQRMQRQFDRSAPGPVVIVGTDIPSIRPDMIMTAFRLLGRHDAVFGPAGDGGYWLVGLKRFPRVLRPFANVRWSSSHTLEDTLRNLAGYRVATTVILDDVDSATDLARHGASIGRRILPAR